MTLHPRVPKDLALAPVAVAIDLNLEHLRAKPPEEIVASLELALNRSVTGGTPAERAGHVLSAALRDVNLHEWHAALTDDLTCIRIAGGSVSLDIGLSRSLITYIDGA